MFIVCKLNNFKMWENIRINCIYLCIQRKLRQQHQKGWYLDFILLRCLVAQQLIKRPRRVFTVFINYHHKSGMHKKFFRCGKKLLGSHELKNDLKWVANICNLIWVDINSNFWFLKRIELIQLSMGNDLIWFNWFFCEFVPSLPWAHST